MREIKYMELDVSIKPKIEAFFRESGGINIWKSHDLGDPSKRKFTPLTQTEKPGWQFPEYVPLTDYAKIKWYTWIPLDLTWIWGNVIADLTAALFKQVTAFDQLYEDKIK